MIGTLVAQFLFALFVLPFCNTQKSRQLFFLVLGLGTAFYCSGFWAFSFIGLIAFTWWALARWKSPNAKTIVTLTILIHWVTLKWLNSNSDFPLPVGISYVSFILLSALYVGDRFQSEVEDFWKFLTTSIFFPVFTSGPVVNYQQSYTGVFRPVEKLKALAPVFLLLIWGLLKKAFADQLAPLNTTLPDSAHITWDQAWLSTFAIHIRLYLDFSGYSDCAIALGLMCGLKLPDNFNLPFLATSTAEFWRRWHMSLGDWIRHHFFMPMVARYAKAKKLLSLSQNIYLKLSLLCTMMVIGLWHGINLNFILWGLFNSYFIIWGDRFFNLIKKLPFVGRPFAILVVFIIGSLGHIFFINPELKDNLTIFKSLVKFETAVTTTSFMWATLAFVLIFTHWFDYQLKKNPFSRNLCIFLSFLFLVVYFILGRRGEPFVYSRF